MDWSEWGLSISLIEWNFSKSTADKLENILIDIYDKEHHGYTDNIESFQDEFIEKVNAELKNKNIMEFGLENNNDSGYWNDSLDIVLYKSIG